MNNIVTFDTAKRLKEVDFPQPDPGDFQFWYVDDGANEWGITVIIKCGGMQEAILKRYGSRIFAPTATDILRVIYNHFASMPGYSVDIRLSPTENGFHVDVFEDLPFDTINKVWEFHENAAEAAALAWLKTREK